MSCNGLCVGDDERGREGIERDSITSATRFEKIPTRFGLPSRDSEPSRSIRAPRKKLNHHETRELQLQKDTEVGRIYCLPMTLT